MFQKTPTSLPLLFLILLFFIRVCLCREARETTGRVSFMAFFALPTEAKDSRELDSETTMERYIRCVISAADTRTSPSPRSPSDAPALSASGVPLGAFSPLSHNRSGTWDRIRRRVGSGRRPRKSRWVQSPVSHTQTHAGFYAESFNNINRIIMWFVFLVPTCQML